MLTRQEGQVLSVHFYVVIVQPIAEHDTQDGNSLARIKLVGTNTK